MKLEEYIEKHKDLAEEIGYNGCRNCKYQIEPLRRCEAAENGAYGDRVYLICPGWEKKDSEIPCEDALENLSKEDFFRKGGEIHIDWSLEMGDKE